MSDKDKMELVRKVGLFGLKDLRKLAQIGDLGYANGWYSPFGDGSFMNGGLERAILHEFHEQGFKVDYSRDSGWARTDHYSKCTELGLSWSVDSSG